MALTGMQGLDLYNFVGQLQQIGVYDVILPFLLVFTIVFAVLQKVKIFGDTKNINLIVALIIGFLFLQNNYLIFVLQRFLPNVSLFLIIFLMFLLAIGIFTGQQKGVSGAALTFAFVISIIAILIAITTDFGPYWFGYSLLDFLYNIPPIIWVVIIFAVVIAFVTHEKKGPGEGIGKVIKNIAEGFKGS